jgi:uncharacterized membrane protein
MKLSAEEQIMKLHWQRFLFILGLLLTWIFIPFVVVWQELLGVWDSLSIWHGIKHQYRDTTKEFTEFWKYDFSVDEINKARKNRKIKS